MSPLTVTSVASAAIISGDLIIGLSDGSIINCGRVQGPQGLDGPAGPIGAPGRPGQDGNTILTSEGFPRADVGTNGDYIIDKVSWTIYGPKASGVWGIGTPLRGNGGSGSAQKRDLADGVPTSGDGSSGGGRAYNTSNLPLSGLGRTKADRKINAPGGNIIPEADDLRYQANLNRWIVNSFVALDDALPVSVGDVLPDEGDYEGDLFLKDGLLFIYTKGEWIAVGGESGPPVYVGEDEPPGTPQEGELWYSTKDTELTLFIYTGTVWAPAAPPVSLKGIENSIANVDAELMKVNANIAMNKRDIDEAILDVREDQTKQDDAIGAIQADQTKQDDAISANSRENTQLRSRIGDVEIGQAKQDERLDKLEKEEDETVARLFGSPYRFRSHGVPTNLTEGEFTYDKDWNWYAHRYDAAGDRIGISKEDGYTHDGMFKVYRHNGAINLICIMHRYDVCKTGQKNTNYFEWRNKESPYTHVEWLEESKLYYLSDGFLLPQ